MPIFVKCKQCGELKATQFFRKYYSGRTGYNKVCLPCESINTRYKYLTKKHLSVDLEISAIEMDELQAMDELYQIQRAAGLKPPGSNRKNTSAKDLVEAELHKHQEAVEATRVVLPDVDNAAPPELLEWLTKDLTGLDTEYLQEDVAEDLQARYRPVLRVDPVTLLPVHDDTHRDVLNLILKRFDDYEDNL